MTRKKTYISLFSSGGIGCYGFKQASFECIATVELIKKRLEIQKYNNKCKYESGYINGDLTQKKIKNNINYEIKKWKENEHIKNVDVIIATPPCQGMSTANSKKNDKDIFRNSLVIESIDIVDSIKPNFFIFENVPAFMKTKCLVFNKEYSIGEFIYSRLSKDYSIFHKVINFKEYGVPSSRKRCLVIGVKNILSSFISPIELFPDFIQKSTTIRDCIFKLKRLKEMGEIDPEDIFHFFRGYDEKMRPWISNLGEGQSAHENSIDVLKPHKIINGQIVMNSNKMGGKYKRQFWDQVAPCIHTRNDQLASQNTIHPEDDRVFSIRELMLFMTVPKSFSWSNVSEKNLNLLTTNEKVDFLKKNELNIRQVLGEAVPTKIFQSIANKIKFSLDEKYIKNVENVLSFEKSNPNRNINEAFYTDKFLVNEIMKIIPDFSNKDEIRILEPSVGLGSFVPLIFKKFEKVKKVTFDLVDIDKNTLNFLRHNLTFKGIPKNFKINFINSDFLLHDFKNVKYDLVIGNPPFNFKLDKEYRMKLELLFGKQKSNNSLVYFLLKSVLISKSVSLILPKNFLIAPQYNEIRNMLVNFKINSIIDFSNLGFEDVLMDTMNIFVEKEKLTSNKSYCVDVIDYKTGRKLIQKNNYIFDTKFPNWIIYRDDFFDRLVSEMELNVFQSFRDRQISNKYLKNYKFTNNIQVLRSRNLNLDRKIMNIDGYDKYIDKKTAEKFQSYKYLDTKNVYLCPNFTTNIRVVEKPLNTLVNGSLAIFENRKKIKIKNDDLKWFSSDEFIQFYRISNNFLTNTINIDKNSIYYFGIRR